MLLFEFDVGLKLKVSVIYSGCGVETEIDSPLLLVKLISVFILIISSSDIDLTSLNVYLLYVFLNMF